jgi:hypothetical protein
VFCISVLCLKISKFETEFEYQKLRQKLDILGMLEVKLSDKHSNLAYRGAEGMKAKKVL